LILKIEKENLQLKEKIVERANEEIKKLEYEL
jgi:hypothetical protein